MSTSKSNLAGAAALVVGPLLALIFAIVAPSVSDDAGDQVAALGDHRSTVIFGLVLQTIAIVLLTAGTIWLAIVVARRAPRLGLWGGILGVFGSLVVLWEDGVSAAMPAIASGLGQAQATAVVDRVTSSAAISGLEPVTTVSDIGLVLLAVAAVRSGAPRWAAIAFAVGSFVETAGFATGTRALLLVGFALLVVGFAGVARALLGSPAAERVGEAGAVAA